MSSESSMSIPEWDWKTGGARPHTFDILQGGLTRICPALSGNERLLDIGCGNAAFTEIFAERGCAVVGIDASPSGIEHARDRLPDGRFECMEICDDMLGALGEEPFDLVLSTEVVEHLYDPRQWARACYNSLKPGGAMMCSTPYHGYLKNLLISLTDGWDRHLQPYKDGGHIKFWSFRTLGALLEDVGFTIERRTGAGRVPWLWNSMVVLARKPS
ncbi:MAG: class I SAM-dependent methyltransferase [Phycisphaerales bacterium JB043]